MAQFVDDNIVEIFFGKMNDFVVEIEISFSAAASPAGFLIAD